MDNNGLLMGYTESNTSSHLLGTVISVILISKQETGFQTQIASVWSDLTGKNIVKLILANYP